MWKRLFVVALLVFAAQSIGAPAATKLLNVSYDPTREFCQDDNAAFAKAWKSKTGEDYRAAEADVEDSVSSLPEVAVSVSGSVTMKVDPLPNVLSTRMEPP